MGAFRDLTGMTVGRLTVVKRRGTANLRHPRWLCECSCGNTTLVRSQRLVKGNTRSCGCLKAEVAKLTSLTHGQSRTKVFRVWAQMIQRCTNPNDKKYRRYGGRGITIAPEWMDFAVFNRDMGSRPPGTSLERLDNDGPYAAFNCIWGTVEEQSNNRSTNRTFVIGGQKMTIAQIARHIGIQDRTLRERLTRYGWTLERAISTPPRKRPHV